MISPTTEVLQDPLLCHSPLPVHKAISEGTVASPPNAPRKPSFLEYEIPSLFKQAKANSPTDGKGQIRYQGNHFGRNLAISLKIMSDQV